MDYEVMLTGSACNLQESVITTVVKLCLKSFLEFVRLQTFNRSGFQQIQLDIQFLRASLKEIVEDEAAIDFLLDEVNQGITRLKALKFNPGNLLLELMLVCFFII